MYKLFDLVLITNAVFVESIGLDQELIGAMRWVIVGILGLYALPITIYIILYIKCRIVIDLLFSTVSFLFYSPTYLNILNIYALCRINDISWATKGLDTDSTVKDKST